MPSKRRTAVSKADAKHREERRALWSAVYQMHYNIKRKGTWSAAALHADNAVRLFDARFGKVPEGQGNL